MLMLTFLFMVFNQSSFSSTLSLRKAKAGAFLCVLYPVLNYKKNQYNKIGYNFYLISIKKSMCY